MLTALNNTKVAATESCFSLLTTHTRATSGPVIRIYFSIRIAEDDFAILTQQLPQRVYGDVVKNVTCGHHLQGQYNAVAFVFRSWPGPTTALVKGSSLGSGDKYLVLLTELKT